ncbi:uncharacterized protein LOC123309604 [Coccinella septempunctata]|uniref:uncharacterized protein LOC123309604 n=1 Tax=Coccinella septempunctata TaxID=41139 RepID=UPI001D079826|nr:uncharacterized protein LOC123309604 [Coccinella septempunctata]
MSRKIIIFLIMLHMSIQDDFQNENIENCRERNRLITTEKGDLYALVDATVGEKLIMQCHYCKEKDDTRPKIWYSVDVFGVSEPQEVAISMQNDISNNRIQLTPDHSLVILNFTFDDTGVYFCMGVEDIDTLEKINYLVDLVEKVNVSNVEKGNLTDWLKYHEDNMSPINYLFKNSLSPEYVYIREKLKLALELKTDWDPWGRCEVCGRTKGIRTRLGRCRIKIEQIQMSEDYKLFTQDEIFLVNAFEVSCRSLIVKRLVPTIFNSTRIVPDFTETQECEGVCNPDALGENAGWKTGKTMSYKYRKTVVMSEGDHLILICPESSLDNEIIWKRNGKVLKRGEPLKPEKKDEEPRILVDTFSTLYLVEVKATEQGNYTCIVDGIQMQQVMVFIASKSKILTKLFLRHLMYLGFVLSLTSFCYIGGLIIACKKRHTFKTYRMLRDEAKKSGKEEESEEDD